MLPNSQQQQFQVHGRFIVMTRSHRGSSALPQPLRLQLRLLPCVARRQIQSCCCADLRGRESESDASADGEPDRKTDDTNDAFAQAFRRKRGGQGRLFVGRRHLR